MDDIAGRYAPMIEQMADMWADHASVRAQLRCLKVTREEWDADRRGGHFWFSVTAPPESRDVECTVDALADDADGASIDIILHPVDGVLNWGEWYRVPLSLGDWKRPITRWPPLSIRR